MQQGAPCVPSSAAGVAWLPGASLNAESAHSAAVANSLALADEAAAVGDYVNALRWLHMLEAIGEPLPGGYLAKRRAWASQVIQGDPPSKDERPA